MTRLTFLALLAVCGVVWWRWGRRETARDWREPVPDAWRDMERVDAV